MQDERLIELMSGSLDGVLSAEEASELDAALSSSADARQLMDQLLADKQGLRQLPALAAPEHLKQRALLKAKASRSSSGSAWTRRLLMAASLFLAAGLFWQYRPLAGVRSRLHLRPGQLAAKAAQVSEELSLAAVGEKNPHVMLSEAVSGRYNGGTAMVHLKCDAGAVAGGRLTVRLAMDFDGDGKFDAHSQPQVLEVDDQEGYQELACELPISEGMKDLTKGKVKVELSTENGSKPPLKVMLDPEQARVDLPYDGLSHHRDNPS